MSEIELPTPHTSSTHENKGLLLVVDDEALNLDMLSRRLERSGYSVQVASSGREALKLISENSFDLVLLDQMMPGMSGAEVLHTLRSELSTEVLPVIMVTAMAGSDRIIEALENGANDYITKPVDYKVALARIRSQLARKRAEAALRQSEERYALAAKASRDGLWDWDLCTGVVYYSPRWKEMLGLGDEVEPNAEAWFSRIVAADRAATVTAVETYLRGSDDVLQCAYRMLHADGSMRWMACHGITTRGESGDPIRVAGSQSDVTDEKTRDALTGLPNRLMLIAQLDYDIAREIERARSGVSAQPSPSSQALLFLDLDEFKTINDSLGHVAGDHLLKDVAARLTLAGEARALEDGNTRPPLVARMGGDEFAILLESARPGVAIVALASEVQRQMREVFDLDGIPVLCTFSIGAALGSPAHRGAEDILREADIAMYTAKAQNRGELVIFNPRMGDIASQQLELENDIRSAVAGNELEVLYQPKVDLSTGLTYGVEGLVRWNHPTRGLLQPGVFIPIAEKTGVIVDIGKWVLQHACLQVRVWHKQFPLGPPLELSVNLSPREFKQKNLVEEVRRILLETDFPPALLHLEITESVLLDDMTAARATLYALKEMGVGLDIDDFGSGYSSLKYLRELPFDSLKIDRYFTAGLDPSHPVSGELIRAILTMANVLGLEVVAEGIESQMHSTTLQTLGCRYGQGFFFARPLNATAVHDLLTLERSALSPFCPPILLSPPLRPAEGTL